MQQNWQTTLSKHNRNVPRYTSYPTAPHFNETVTSESVKGWLHHTKSNSSLSLYFHIPFCHQLCWYCGCNTKATKQYAPVQQYLIYLKQEIEKVSLALAGQNPVTHIHFGGGSPSYLHPDDFRNLMAHIKKHFLLSPTAEIAIELDPREITEGKVAAYAQYGVNRASLGVQDFNSTVQKAINRVQPFHMIFKATELLRRYDIHAISFDLLYGLPHQTTEILLENVDLASSMSPDRITLFGYAHVPWMKKHMRLIKDETLPDTEARLAQFCAASQRLEQFGYRQIGLDHFVKPDDPMALAYDERRLRRNFQGYTTDQANTLIGFGASAISAFDQGYAQNTPDTRSYFNAIDAGKLPIQKGIRLSDDDRMCRDIIEKIMCYGEVDLRKMAAHYDQPISIFDPAIEQLHPLFQDALASYKDSILMVQPEVAQASRLVAAAFDHYLGDTSRKHAQVA